MSVSIFKINQMNQPNFVDRLGAIFEETPSISEQVWLHRPFTDVADLHSKMVAIVEAMPLAQKLDLIKAHPELGSQAKMAAASVQEQASVGLTSASPPTYTQLDILNARYREKFSFPFVMAVKGQTREMIIAAFERRLQNFREDEIEQALLEIARIARFRLDELID